MSEKRSITLHSNEVNDLIGDIPPGIVIRGAAVIILATVALIVLSGLIPYPELLRGTGKMASDRTAVVKLNGVPNEQLIAGSDLVLRLDSGHGEMKTIKCNISSLDDNNITITANTPEELFVLKNQLAGGGEAPVYIVLKKEQNLRQAIFNSLTGFF
jgi:hypothetical protein